jgi:hypothetical protein
MAVDANGVFIAGASGDGNLTSWNPSANSALGVFALTGSGTVLTAGGDFTRSGRPRPAGLRQVHRVARLAAPGSDPAPGSALEGGSDLLGQAVDARVGRRPVQEAVLELRHPGDLGVDDPVSRA